MEKASLLCFGLGINPAILPNFIVFLVLLNFQCGPVVQVRARPSWHCCPPSWQLLRTRAASTSWHPMTTWLAVMRRTWDRSYVSWASQWDWCSPPWRREIVLKVEDGSELGMMGDVLAYPWEPNVSQSALPVLPENETIHWLTYDQNPPSQSGLGAFMSVSHPVAQVADRQKAYKCDVVYLTNAELGFDYLRDNLAVYPHQVVQNKNFHFCLVDEAAPCCWFTRMDWWFESIWQNSIQHPKAHSSTLLQS